jgi:hypothetical protein
VLHINFDAYGCCGRKKQEPLGQMKFWSRMRVVAIILNLWSLGPASLIPLASGLGAAKRS